MVVCISQPGVMSCQNQSARGRSDYELIPLKICEIKVHLLGQSALSYENEVSTWNLHIFYDGQKCAGNLMDIFPQLISMTALGIARGNFADFRLASSAFVRYPISMLVVFVDGVQ